MAVVRRNARSPESQSRRAETFDRAVSEFFMRIALDEARRGVGRVSPNPAVGAILVKGGRVIARGYHAKAGEPHAEAMALREAGARARGADLYTTLEPCSHHGRTPPCADAILAAGVRRVVSGSADPNPRVDGRGLAKLKEAGVLVEEGVLAEECDHLNRPFFKWIREGLPWLTLKAAMTLDGKLATGTGDSRWITGEDARRHVHELRDRVDAILVGANTVRLDDPLLTCRLDHEAARAPARATKAAAGDANGAVEDGGGVGSRAHRNPVRVVLDSRLELPLKRKVFTTLDQARTVVATCAPLDSPKAKRLQAAGVEVWRIREAGGRISLKALLRRMAKESLLHVLCEGGSQLFGALLSQRLADELLLFIAPKVVGDAGLSWVGGLDVKKMAQALTLGALSVEKHGGDVLLTSELRERG